MQGALHINLISSKQCLVPRHSFKTVKKRKKMNKSIAGPSSLQLCSMPTRTVSLRAFTAVHHPQQRWSTLAWGSRKLVGSSGRICSRVMASAEPATEPASKSGNTFPPLFTNLLKPLRDFGIGKVSMVQGGVGLFIFAGIGFALMLVSWARGGQLGRRGQGYQAILEFPVACGISVGTPVRIRGVPVGSVLSVQPSLERVDVLVEMRDGTTVIPRNSLIEANQSGLIAEPLIDITPQLPVPEYVANPLDEDCEKEGKVVCHQGRIKGERGVALDDLVYICTKIAREMDSHGVEKVFAAMESAQAAINDAQPLLQRAVELTNEVRNEGTLCLA